MGEGATPVSEPYKPYEWQNRMIDWVYDRPASGLLCSPSMGKTVVTLKVLEKWMVDGQSRGMLVIAPIRCCSLTWVDQVAKWDHSSWMKVALLRTEEGMKAWENGTADVFLTNPEQLPKLTPRMFKGKKPIPVDTFVWDELSTARNPTGKRAAAIRPYLNRFKQRLGLTGSPIPNSYLDLYGQIRMLDDGARLGKSFYHYRQTYFEPADFWGYTFKLRPGAKEMIDAKIADLCLVMLGDEYLDLPTCNAIDIDVTLPPDGRAEYRKMERDLLIELERSEVVSLTAATLCTKLRQIAGGAVYDDQRGVYHIHDAKIEALKKLRKQHGSEPILVLTEFTHESERILKAIPGSRMFDEKDVPEWRAGKIHTWIANCRSLSHGLDGLQTGHIACWFSLGYSQENYLQTNARLVRIGQSNETLVYRLLVSDSIDQAIVEALRVKNDTQSGMLQALRNLQKLHAK